MTIFYKDPARDIYQFRHYDEVFYQIFGKMMQADMIASTFVVDNTAFRRMYDTEEIKWFLARTYKEVLNSYGQMLGFMDTTCVSAATDFSNMWRATVDEWEKQTKLISKDGDLINVLVI